MSQPTTLVLNHPSPYDRLGENSRIVIGVLRDDGWTIDRVESGQHLLLCAVPYLSKDEEEMQAVRMRALDAARKARLRRELKSLRISCLAFAAIPLVVGTYGLIVDNPNSFFTFFAGCVLLNSAIGFLIKERRHV